MTSNIKVCRQPAGGSLVSLGAAAGDSASGAAASGGGVGFSGEGAASGFGSSSETAEGEENQTVRLETESEPKLKLVTHSARTQKVVCLLVKNKVSFGRDIFTL